MISLLMAAAQSAHRFGFGVLFRVGTPQTRHGSIMRISVCDSGRAEASAKAINPAQRRPPPRQSPTARTRFKRFDPSQTFWCRGLWGVGFNEQIFGADEQNLGRGQSD